MTFEITKDKEANYKGGAVFFFSHVFYSVELYNLTTVSNQGKLAEKDAISSLIFANFGAGHVLTPTSYSNFCGCYK